MRLEAAPIKRTRRAADEIRRARWQSCLEGILEFSIVGVLMTPFESFDSEADKTSFPGSAQALTPLVSRPVVVGRQLH